MRIDLNQAASLAETDRGSNKNQVSSGSAVSAGSLLGEDQAQLSGGHAQVQALAAQAVQLPEVNQEKVNALRQTVIAGGYQPGAQQVAAALFNHMAVPAA